MWHVVHNDQLRTKIVGFANVERCIMEFGLIYIGKRTMIYLHTFEDDVLCVERIALPLWLPMN